MQMQLSQKERMLLEDQKSQEELCIIKYRSYSQQAQDPQLKQLFDKHASEEQHHFDMINQMLQGQQPNMSHQNVGQQQGWQSQQSQPQLSQQSQQSLMKNNDKILCSDLLTTEKYVSGTYDTGVFEAANPAIRQALQHIQQDEQRHGEDIFNYMNSHGMYNVQ